MYRRFRTAAVVLFIVCTTGCGAIATLTYSHPSVEGVRALGAAPVVLNVDPHVLVYVASTNNRIVQSFDRVLFIPIYEHKQYRGSWESPYYRNVSGKSMAEPPVFIIEVLIVSGQGLVIFDPSHTCLNFPRQSKQKHCTSAMRKPGAPIGNPSAWYKEQQRSYAYKGVNLGAICQGAYDRLNSGQISFDDFKALDSDRIITATPGNPACVALLFNIPAPDPSQPFKLSLGTLKFENRELKLPEISYEQGTVKTAAGLM